MTSLQRAPVQSCCKQNIFKNHFLPKEELISNIIIFCTSIKIYNFDIFLIFNFQMSVHQVHILCLVAHLRHLNRYTTPYPRVGHSSTGTPCSIFPHICFASVKNTDRPTMLRFIQKRNLVKGFSKLNCNIILYIHRTKQD